MIQIVPSISIAGGKVAKMASGAQAPHYFDKNPLDLALFFQDQGFRRLHLVDLDGAREQSVINYQTLEVISGHTDLEINFSGGIRTDGGVQLAFEYGAQTVTVATVAALRPDIFMSWMISFGRERLVLGVDMKDGFIATKGWAADTNLRADAHLEYFYERGVVNVKCTDVSRDGLMEGPNFEWISSVRRDFPDYKIMVSGGVRNIADIEQLDELGVDSVIISRALIEGKIDIAELRSFAVAQ